MVELNRSQRAVLVDKVPDVANVGVGALFFGQFLGERAFSPSLAAFGVVLWATLIGFTVWLAAGDES